MLQQSSPPKSRQIPLTCGWAKHMGWHNFYAPRGRRAAAHSETHGQQTRPWSHAREGFRLLQYDSRLHGPRRYLRATQHGQRRGDSKARPLQADDNCRGRVLLTMHAGTERGMVSHEALEGLGRQPVPRRTRGKRAPQHCQRGSRGLRRRPLGTAACVLGGPWRRSIGASCVGSGDPPMLGAGSDFFSRCLTMQCCRGPWMACSEWTGRRHCGHGGRGKPKHRCELIGAGPRRPPRG
jgi:hypothetical protein